MSGTVTPLDGRIELRGLLGTGGMGEVHRAWDQALERAVAVKFFHGASPLEAERLLLEGRLQARVEHPNVVRVLDVGALDGRPCLVLQLVEGQSLDVAAPRLSLSELVELVRQAALGVHAAHREGLVHRDVKPGNVLVEQGPDGPKALVTDFGLARGDGPGLTRSGGGPGTLAFMSPEQLVGGPVGFAADVYSLGATLYAALAGHSPHMHAPASGSPGTPPADLYRRIVEEPPPPLPKAVPAPLARVATKAMEKQPGARYQSAEAFAADLERFQRGEAVMARPPSRVERLLVWRQHNRLVARAMAAAAVALFLSLGWGLWSTLRADADAVEAARLGALGEAMEAALRMEYLGPPHDVRPALARVRAQVEALRAPARGGSGPANFALAKGLELLGDVEGARAAYEKAWAKGFRSEQVAQGLGRALGELYRRGYRGAVDSLEPKAREARLATLRRELRAPAIKHLEAAHASGAQVAYLQASVALLEGDFRAARARVAEALAADPRLYEARLLEAETHSEEAAALAKSGHREEAITRYQRVLELTEEAARFGRSDPRVGQMRLKATYGQLSGRAVRGERLEEARASFARALEQARGLNPEDPTLLVMEAKSLTQTIGKGAASAAVEWRIAEHAVELLVQAEKADPSSAEVLGSLGQALYAVAHFSKQAGAPSLAPVEQGLAVVERAAALAPWDPELLLVRSRLRRAEAGVLSVQGRSTALALRRAAEASEEALRRGARDVTDVRSDLGEVRVALGSEAWSSGEDPRPDLEAGLALLDQTMGEQPDAVGLAATMAAARKETAELLFAMGLDGRPHLDHAQAALVAVIPRTPQAQMLEGRLAELHVARAAFLAASGVDPTASVAEARRLYEKLRPARAGQLSFDVRVAELVLFEGQWERSRGGDPTARLIAAEAEFKRLLEAHPESPSVKQGLARCALEQALVARQRGGDAVTVARSGAEWISRALEKEPRTPEAWALRGRLLVMAGDAVAAKESLERAWATNPLVRGGLDSRLAEAELSADGGRALK
jgi:serine/threonine-protein kinase